MARLDDVPTAAIASAVPTPELASTLNLAPAVARRGWRVGGVGTYRDKRRGDGRRRRRCCTALVDHLRTTKHITVQTECLRTRAPGCESVRVHAVL
eukprot:6202036-Pleurochrysis_carterae.AAC.1